LDGLEGLFLSEQRLLEIRTGQTQTVPLEDAMRCYGMEG